MKGAAALARTEWEEMIVPAGTIHPLARLPSSTAGRGEAAVTYAKHGAAPASMPGTTSGPGVTAPAPSVFMLPVHATPKQKFIPLSRREGVVLEVRNDEFDARLVDLDGEEGDLEATFAVEELSLDDVSLLRNGAVFYWTIGYFDDQVRRRTRVSELRFRRLPAEDSRRFANAAIEADQIRRELGLE